MYLEIWLIARKINSLYSQGLHAFSKVWLKWDDSLGSSSLLKILTSELLQSAPNDHQTEVKESDMKSTLQCSTSRPRVRNGRPSRSTVSRFQGVAHFRIFPLTSMLKFQSAT